MKKHYTALCVFLVMSILFGIDVFAMNTGLELTDLESNVTFIENFDIKKLDSEPRKREIACFAVSDTGNVAVGYATMRLSKIIAIYSPENEFIYGYSFKLSRGDFFIEWDGDGLIIYFNAPSLAIYVNENGEILEACDVVKSKTSRDYRENVLKSPNKSIGDKEYYISNKVGWPLCYTSLGVDTGDQHIILIDVSSLYIIKCVAFALLVVSPNIIRIIRRKRR